MKKISKVTLFAFIYFSFTIPNSVALAESRESFIRACQRRGQSVERCSQEWNIQKNREYEKWKEFCRAAARIAEGIGNAGPTFNFNFNLCLQQQCPQQQCSSFNVLDNSYISLKKIY